MNNNTQNSIFFKVYATKNICHSQELHEVGKCVGNSNLYTTKDSTWAEGA